MCMTTTEARVCVWSLKARAWAWSWIHIPGSHSQGEKVEWGRDGASLERKVAKRVGFFFFIRLFTERTKACEWYLTITEVLCAAQHLQNNRVCQRWSLRRQLMGRTRLWSRWLQTEAGESGLCWLEDYLVYWHKADRNQLRAVVDTGKWWMSWSMHTGG